MKKYNNWLSLTYYCKGKNYTWYCEYIGVINDEYIKGKTKATGYGYDKESTCLSNAINKFKEYWIRYNKNAKKYSSYGLYNDNTISYGIGYSAVRACLKCFKNVKISSEYFGINENSLTIKFYNNDSE